MAEETKAKGRPRGRGRRARTRGLYKRGGGREGQLTSSGGSGLSGPPYPPSVVGGPSSTPFSILEGEAPPEKWPKEREGEIGTFCRGEGIERRRRLCHFVCHFRFLPPPPMDP